MRTKNQTKRTSLYNLWCVCVRAETAGASLCRPELKTSQRGGICAYVFVAWLLTYTNAMKIDVGCNRDGTEQKRQEFECGHPFPLWCNVLPLVDGQKAEQQTERHNEGERSKAHLLMRAGAFTSAGLTWDLDVAQPVI